MKKQNNLFDCPVCGNPLIKSKNYEKIRCVYCKSLVDVPKTNKKKKGGEDYE